MSTLFAVGELRRIHPTLDVTMRVLIVTGILQPEQLAIWDAIDQRGVDLHIAGSLWSPWSDGLPWEPRAPRAGEVHVFRPRGWLTRGYTWWAYPGLAQLIRNLQPDVVHVVSEPWGLLVLQAHRGRQPVVAHGSEISFGAGSAFERSIRRVVLAWSLPRLAGYVSANRGGLRAIAALGLPPDRPTAIVSKILPDPAPFERAVRTRRRARRQLGLPEGAVVIGYVGRLHREKGLFWLLDAFEHMSQRGVLVYVGSGPDRNELTMRAAGSPRDVRILAGVPLRDVPAVLAALDIVTAPSHVEERFGRIIVEAMFSHRPIIASDAGALPEVIGDAGIIVPRDQPEVLVEELDRLASQPTLRNHLGAAANARAHRHFTPESAADQVMGVWQQVTG